MDELKFVLVIVVVLALITSLIVDIVSPQYGFFARVDSGNVGIVTHFGKIEDRVLPAGFHITSFFEHVRPINIRTQMGRTELIAFSADIQQVTLDVAVNYNVTPDAAHTLYTTVGTDYVNTLMLPRFNEDVKAVVSNYTAEGLISNREKLSNEILELMQHDMSVYGITVSAVSVVNIDFTDAFENAVEAKQVATQDAQRAKTMQEQQTMEARQEAERRKLAADADAEVVRKQADAEAYQTKVKAEAQAEANRLVAETVTDELISYVEAQQWDGKLPNIYASGGALPIITQSFETTKAD